jgi:hypothetical protein
MTRCFLNATSVIFPRVKQVHCVMVIVRENQRDKGRFDKYRPFS